MNELARRRILRWTGPSLALAIWQGIAMAEAIDPLLLPTPTKVFSVYLDASTGPGLLADTLRTMARALAGFAASSVLGISLGLVVGWSRTLYDASEFLIEFFRSLPAAALLPPFLLLFGIGDFSKIALVTFSCTLIVLVYTAAGVKNTSRTRLMVAQMLGATRAQLFSRFILPEALPSVATSLRISISMALILTVVAEMLISTDPGIGRRVLDAQLLFQTADMYAAILLTGALGYLANRVISSAADRLIHWQGH